MDVAGDIPDTRAVLRARFANAGVRRALRAVRDRGRHTKAAHRELSAGAPCRYRVQSPGRDANRRCVARSVPPTALTDQPDPHRRTDPGSPPRGAPAFRVAFAVTRSTGVHGGQGFRHACVPADRATARRTRPTARILAGPTRADSMLRQAGSARDWVLEDHRVVRQAVPAGFANRSRRVRVLRLGQVPGRLHAGRAPRVARPRV